MESEELKLILKQQAQIMATMQSQMQMLQQQMANKSGINDNDTKSRVNVPWPQPLEVSSGEPSENLSFFKNGWTNYCLATGMNKWGDDKMELKAGLLISAIGSAAMKKYMEFGLTNTDKLSEEAILSKMDETIKKKTNVIYCRYIFNARNQLIEEKFEDYLLTLRKLIKPCDYGDIEDDILRDRIVVGIKDGEVKKELLREADLKLDLTISICRSAETAAEQLTTLQSSECEINEISKYKKNYKEVQQCKFCGQKHIFGRDRCPAYGKRCEACKGRNHFKLVCKKDGHHRAIREVREDYNSSEEEHVIKAIRANKKSGHTEAELLFKIRGKLIPVFCTLDTGAQVCVMSISDYKRLTGSEDVSSLATPLHKLKCYNGSELVEYGVAQLECVKDNKHYRIEFHIVEASHEPLLSENACLSLGLIKYCNSVNSGNIKDRAKAIELFKEYSDIFEGYGKLPGEVSLEIDASVPPRIQSARRVPMAVREKLKQELHQLEKDGIIIQEMQHTDWVNNILIVHKDSKFRICLDPIPLNKALKRPNYQFTTLDEMLPELDKAKVFTTVDTKKGFWQLGLTEDSSKLTTFWTPFGRFRWLRLPFGLCSSPEIFQQKLSSLLSGLKGVEIIADDILIYGVGDSTEEAIVDHNIKLEELFKRLRKINCKLNKDKVHLLQSSVKFYGHVLTSEGVKVDESKVMAIKNMPTPESAKDVLRFLGMVGYLGKFIKNLSFQANSLRKLTRKDTEFHWSQTEEMEFNNIKKIISELPTLKFFDVNKNVSIECDASEFGLGAALYQDDQVVCFASRCLTPTEKRYAQIEKEMLAVVFACTKFNQYIAGKGKVTIKTDHKPLVNIMNKPLIDAPKRLQMMLMTLQKYNVELQFIQGKDNHVADTLSRAPIVEQSDTVYDLESELSQKQVFKLISEHSKISFLKISDKLIMKIKEETERDHNLQIIMDYIMNGFPRYISDWPIELRALYKFRHELSTKDGLIFRNDQLLIPIRLRKVMTEKVHVSHNGISATLRLARENIFWPGMTVDIKEHVGKCKFCAENAASQERQSLMSHEIPMYPFQYISMDVFSINNLKFLITVDHYSDFFELDPLSSLTTREVIQICKKNFSRHGAPQKVCSDNATNFNNEEFKKFAEDWNFEHVTSSPHFPSSNGKAEATVKVARRLVVASLETKQDLWYSLLHHRNIPIEADKVSPVQKLFSRRTRTGLPCVLDHLKPKVVHKVPVLIKKRKEKVKERYDSRSKGLPKLALGESVMVQLQPESSKRWNFGKVVHIHNERSFTVQVNDKLYRRNRVHIKPFLGDVTQTEPVENRRVAPDEPQTESSFSDISGVPVPGFEVIHYHSPRVLQSPVQAQEAPRRGQRLRLQPRRLQDYVLYQ